MKIAKSLMPLLLIILTLTCLTCCSHADKTDVKAVITQELDLLKNLDSDTTQKYVSYKELFPDTTENTALSNDIKEVFSLFFQNFDYKILNIDVDTNQQEASASLRLSTIDAQTLAEDYCKASLETAVLKAADSEELTTEETSDSLEDRYLILGQLLKDNSYETIKHECTIQLINIDSKWEIIRSHSLEDDFVGGLMTYLSNNKLLSSEETLTVYLNTLKKMDTEQMGNYLGIESLFNTSDADKNSIAAALVEQVHKNFDFKIITCNESGYNATIETEITTFDSNTILSSYQENLDTYLASADAVIDGAANRHQKSMDFLLTEIEENTATITTSADFHLTNDGVSWKLNDNNEAIGNAIFGILSNSPVTDEDEIS